LSKYTPVWRETTVYYNEPHRAYAISQSPEDSLDPLLAHNPDYDISRFPAEPDSVIQDGEFKYYGFPGESELYRLLDERESVIKERPDVAARLDEHLTGWLERNCERVSSGEMIEVDESTRERLADLGYLDSEM
jgi:hypothetical protein